MATVEELRLFLQERLRAMDSTIRLEDGSPASVQVVEPTVRRFTPDALETDFEAFAKARLTQEFPSMITEEGSAIVDLVMKPMQILLEPFVREIRAIRRNQSLLDPSVLNKDEADALLGNIFVRRRTGDYSKGTVRAYFTNPVSANIGGSNTAFTATGLRFRPVTPQSITSESMIFNTDGGLYYFDVTYVAEGVGRSYNVAPNAIIGITNLPAATRVRNLRKFESGLNEETTLEVVSRGEQSIGERSLTTVPGIVSRLYDQFEDLRILNVVGFNDAEMQRDVITGGNLGVPLSYGVDGATADDGDADGYTPYFDSAVGAFTSLLGPAGSDASGYVLTAWMMKAGDLQPIDYDLKEVVSATRVAIADTYTGDDRIPEPQTTVTWVVRKRSLTLSDVPGGILFPDVGGITVDVPEDEIHVGGCTDMYVAGNATETATLAISIFGTYEPAIRAKTAATFGPADRSVDLTSMTNVDFLKVIVGKSSVRLMSGADTGTYRIISSTWVGPSTIRLEVDRELTATDSAILFDVADSVDIGLTEPKEVLTSGTDLRTYAGANIVDTGSGKTWTDFGITTDHILEILNGDDAEEYSINLVSGSVLTLAATLSQTADPIQYRVLRKQDEAINLPLMRVKSVERLDSNLEPTGDFVPYKHVIDSRSTSFQNPGRGAKAGTEDVTTDDTLSVTPSLDPRKVTSSNTAIDYYALGVRPGNIVNVNTGDNTGYYVVARDGVGGSPAAAIGLLDYEFLVESDLEWPDSAMSYAVGEPSYGSFRLYFLEPVSVEVTADGTLISVDIGDVSRRFRPDPTMWDEYFPTDDTIPTFSASSSSAVADLYAPGGASAYETVVYGVETDDRVEVTFAPVVGSKAHASATTALDGKTLLLDLGRGAERITFTGTIGIDDIVSQVNTQASRSVAAKWADGGDNYFMLRSNQEVTILDNSADSDDATDDVFGTDRSTNNPWHSSGVFAGGVSPNDQTDNDSPHKGFWYVVGAAGTSMTLEDGDGVAFNPADNVDSELGHYMIFARSGRQRITSTQMNEQRDVLGLYYFDVECVSEGHGDSWNVNPDLRGIVAGYDSEGWDMTVEDRDQSYSMAEEPWLHVSPRVLVVGANYDPGNYTELVGESFQITYERAPIVEQVHAFVRDQQERVVCESPLARSLLPIFVRTYLEYRGGPTETDLRSEITGLVEKVLPEQQLEVSDITGKATRFGASYILMPVTVVGIGHQLDRTIVVERSQDAISTERLSALIPDDDGTTTEGSSWILLNRS